MRPTIRARLTLLYGGMFVVAGLVLLTLTYVLVQNSLRGPRGDLVNQLVTSAQVPSPQGQQSSETDPLTLLRTSPGTKLIPQSPAGKQPTDTQSTGKQPTDTQSTGKQPTDMQSTGKQPSDTERLGKTPTKLQTPEGNTGAGPQVRVITPGEVPQGTVLGGGVNGSKAGIFFQKQKVGGAAADFQKATLNSVLTQGAIALGLVALAALGLGWLMADRALRPVQRITETARRVARSHDLTERIGYTGPRDEVRELADTFDTMLGRLSRSFDGQRRFVANASHELRTPLAINRTLVDVALRRKGASEDVRRLGESLLVVNERHERLIDGLLTLAGGENEVTERLPVDLADVARHVVDLASAENGEAAGREVTVRGELSPAPTAGDPVLLERLVQNLVENAVRHNHSGGTCRVMTGVHDGWTELTVTNTGPVVPGYETETIFEPFRRLGAERVRSDRGSGLGLSIVRAVAVAHGGSAVASPNPGGGLRVTVRLPNSGPV
ncbi:sensor histidine kinase [Actinomadura rupiterrae]|uniref:sensor histidine kinase n=1 Tax=Actinomadura rupiterrae TaxID=559627 RepID=UPI0020A497A8|nr:HAMP domain-containing sensor histidine kinase [Actinomadura rupiterrae]MCP2340349.1 signal transduction histidine kinase [Actinomadura rupiterrae]